MILPAHRFSRANPRKGTDGEILGYGSRPKCKECETGERAAKRAAAAVDRAQGTKETTADFMSDVWTITEGKKATPVPRMQKYVKFSELSPAFADAHGISPGVKAKVTDLVRRVAHASPVGTDTFVPVADLLAALGVRRCSVCGKTLPLHNFAIANSATGQLRGNCKACQA